MAPNQTLVPVSTTGSGHRLDEKSDSALQLWKAALQNEEGAFKLQCVNYTFTYPDASSTRSSTPLSSDAGDSVCSAEQAAAASAEALRSWRQAAPRCVPKKQAAPSRGLPSMLRIYIPGNNVPWWMTKDWQQGQPKSGFSRIRSSLAGDAYRLLRTVAVASLAGYAVARIMNSKR